jgi:hypothetical protein
MRFGAGDRIEKIPDARKKPVSSFPASGDFSFYGSPLIIDFHPDVNVINLRYLSGKF